MNLNDLLYNFDDDEKVLILGYAINALPATDRAKVEAEIIKNRELLAKIKREVKTNGK